MNAVPIDALVLIFTDMVGHVVTAFNVPKTFELAQDLSCDVFDALGAVCRRAVDDRGRGAL